VTTDQVSAAIDSGAVTLSAVARATRACTSCGLCRERIANMLVAHKDLKDLDHGRAEHGQGLPLEARPAA
jgi:NAD(P)H-nitrite reductase large subunit